MSLVECTSVIIGKNACFWYVPHMLYMGSDPSYPSLFFVCMYSMCAWASAGGGKGGHLPPPGKKKKKKNNHEICENE